jgi:hypothetical protein
MIIGSGRLADLGYDTMVLACFEAFPRDAERKRQPFTNSWTFGVGSLKLLGSRWSSFTLLFS